MDVENREWLRRRIDAAIEAMTVLTSTAHEIGLLGVPKDIYETIAICTPLSNVLRIHSDRLKHER